MGLITHLFYWLGFAVLGLWAYLSLESRKNLDTVIAMAVLSWLVCEYRYEAFVAVVRKLRDKMNADRDR